MKRWQALAARSGLVLFALCWGTGARAQKPEGTPRPPSQIESAIKRDPGLANQRRLCLVGGVVWALATIQQPGARSSYVKLSSADIDTFISRLEASGKDSLPAPEGLARD